MWSIAADATDPTAVAGVIDQAEARFGGVDAVVVTAGVIAGGVPLWEMPEEELRAVLEVDLEAVITVARAAMPALLHRPQRAAAVLLPSPHRPLHAGCRCWRPTARPRPA